MGNGRRTTPPGRGRCPARYSFRQDPYRRGSRARPRQGFRGLWAAGRQRAGRPGRAARRGRRWTSRNADNKIVSRAPCGRAERAGLDPALAGDPDIRRAIVMEDGAGDSVELEHHVHAIRAARTQRCPLAPGVGVEAELDAVESGHMPDIGEHSASLVFRETWMCRRWRNRSEFF